MRNMRFIQAPALCFMLLFSAGSLSAQGFYGNGDGSDWVEQKESVDAVESKNTDGGDDLGAEIWTGSDAKLRSGWEPPTTPGDPGSAPAGEGLLLLLGMGGAYLARRMVRNRKR